MYKNGNRKKRTNYRGVSLLSLPGKVYAKCLERKCREIVESKLEDCQCGFRPGRSTTDQIFTVMQISEKFWEYAKDVFQCFVDLEKANNRIPRDKLWRVLQEYGINGHLFMAIKSLYCSVFLAVFYLGVSVWSQVLTCRLRIFKLQRNLLVAFIQNQVKS